MEKFIKVNLQDDGIMFIGFNRPPVNALSIDFVKELIHIFRNINNNKKCRIVIINSLVNNFCAGADLKERKIMSIKGADNALDILNECLEHERSAIDAYYNLLKIVEGNSIMLEEFSRTQIAAEEMHEAEVKKMLRDNF